MTDTFVVFGVLACAYVEFVVVYDRRGDEVALGASAAKLETGGLRVAVEFPEQLAGGRFEGAKPAVAAGKDDHWLTSDLGISRIRPLAVHDVLPRRVVLPDDF